MADQRITNLAYLKEVTGGDPEILKEFIQMFFEQIAEFSKGLQNHLANKEYKELGLLAHKAKSSVMTFGMEELGHQLKRLQLKTQVMEDVQSYNDDVQNFLDLMVLAKAELSEELEKL